MFLGKTLNQNSCNALLNPVVSMDSTEFNTGGNPAMDWHLVHAIETEICSDGSLGHHPVEVITFF